MKRLQISLRDLCCPQLVLWPEEVTVPVWLIIVEEEASGVTQQQQQIREPCGGVFKVISRLIGYLARTVSGFPFAWEEKSFNFLLKN